MLYSLAAYSRAWKWHFFTVVIGVELSLVSRVFQTFWPKESVVGGTSDVLATCSKRGFMTQSGHLRDLLLD